VSITSVMKVRIWILMTLIVLLVASPREKAGGGEPHPGDEDDQQHDLSAPHHAAWPPWRPACRRSVNDRDDLHCRHGQHEAVAQAVRVHVAQPGQQQDAP
jgi:hypothetical protein